MNQIGLTEMKGFSVTSLDSFDQFCITWIRTYYVLYDSLLLYCSHGIEIMKMSTNVSQF